MLGVVTVRSRPWESIYIYIHRDSQSYISKVLIFCCLSDVKYIRGSPCFMMVKIAYHFSAPYQLLNLPPSLKHGFINTDQQVRNLMKNKTLEATER